jgi:N-acyl-D-amino-acid deacylase
VSGRDVVCSKKLDILVKNGRVIDGTGNPRRFANIGIKGDRIVEVGNLDGADADLCIDAAGKIVCPGFIDAHSHTDSTIFLNPTAESTVRQGVTTEIVGNCGNTHTVGSPDTGGLRDTLRAVREMGTSINLAWLTGHNTLRKAAGVIGTDVSEEQYRIMEKWLRESMEAGSLGISTGLEFEPGRLATTGEIIRLTRIVGEYGGIYASHIRNRDANVQAAVEEFIEIVRSSGVRGEISHLNIRHNTGAPEGAWQKAVETMENARAEGLDILADMTPLTHGIGNATAILPPWIRNMGTAQTAELLYQPDIRLRLRSECDRYWRFIHRGEWNRVYVQSNPAYPEVNGMSFPEISKLWGKDPWECYFDILAAAGEQMDRIVLFARLFTEEHVREAISHPLFMLVMDGNSASIDGPTAAENRNPLHFMGMVYFITHHVREKRTLTLEEAVRKMTGMPATHFGLRDRGLILAGYMADLTILDYEKLEAVATIERPLEYCKGIEHVLVNGVPVILNGEHTGKRPGMNLTRG